MLRFAYPAASTLPKFTEEDDVSYLVWCLIDVFLSAIPIMSIGVQYSNVFHELKPYVSQTPDVSDEYLCTVGSNGGHGDSHQYGCKAPITG